MNHFIYKNGILYAEDVTLQEIASKVGTPFYCYSTATLIHHYKVFSDAFSDVPAMICFAVKANSNVAVLTTLAKLGCGADTVSEGEIRKARAAGIPPEKIVFSGVGKTRNEMRYALGIDIAQFNVESYEELEILNEIADDLGVTARVAIRVNPNVDAKTHDKISTGRKVDKFGVAYEDIRSLYKKTCSLKRINIIGLTTHIGSQLTELTPFKKAFEKISDLVISLRKDGHDIKRLDLGGGLGIPYGQENPPNPYDYASMIVDTVNHLNCELILEPGRLIAGNAGILVSKVILVKRVPNKTFVIIDAAMNDLMRPSLYDTKHEIIPVTLSSPPACGELLSSPPACGELLSSPPACGGGRGGCPQNTKVDVVGSVCETSDTFARDYPMPDVKIDDLVALRSAGAYGAVMSSTYNSRQLIPEVLVNGNAFSVIRNRQTYSEMLKMDNIPNWLLEKQ